jgi:hypothetical protein
VLGICSGAREFELKGRGLLPKRADLSRLTELANANDALYDKYWILAYEAERNGWVTGPGPCRDDPCFSYMKKLGVAFFDSQPIEVIRADIKSSTFPKSASATKVTGDESDTADEFDMWWHRDG